MMWREAVYLMQEIESLDSMRKVTKSYKKRRVYCNEKGVRQSEFYQAGIQGDKPEIMLEVRANEYNGETHVEYKNKVYRVIRTYPKRNEITEIICTSTVHKNGVQ
ncbi:MAG: head-tail adaptor protein [Oscillospiraceae bacterium]|nr:head-tail adaptor protein [Oscillospiraceae bacterium]